VKQFVLDYARYRRLGFDPLDAIDLSLSRRNVVPNTTARLQREREAIAARAQLRIVSAFATRRARQGRGGTRKP
jgi:hypothetical protein